jgi:uncharacterized protein (DUF305 family)
MKTPFISRRSFVGLCVALCTFAASALASGPAPERDQRRFEVSFLTSMIDHHFGGVKLAELCAGRTIHAQLEQLCEDVKSAQSAEITKMQEWLRDWYGITHQPELDRKTQRQIDALSKLTGGDFEKAFMAVMIGHHTQAAHMAIECLNQAYHPEMLNMCAMMLGSQGDEIAMMRIWLIQWYGINDLDRSDHP